MPTQPKKKVSLTYAQFQAISTPGTIANLNQRYIDEMNGTAEQPGIKPLSESQECSMRAMQRRPIGVVIAEQLAGDNIIDYAKARIAEGVLPSTVCHDLSDLSVVLKYARAAWKDCKKVSAEPIKDVKPFLRKHGLYGKSAPRKRRPTAAELEQLLAYFAFQNSRRYSKTDMLEVTLCAIVSTRRQSEITNITYGDLDWERKDDAGNATPMYRVRDMKHPTKKKGNNKWFPIVPQLAEVFRRCPRLRPDDPTERLYPFNPKTVSQRYTLAKKRFGIVDLHFHDNRREAISRWLKLFPPHKVRTYFSGHETNLILERVYDAQDPAGAHDELAQLVAARIATPAPERRA